MWTLLPTRSPTVHHTRPTQIHCVISEELPIRRRCEFDGVQCRWQPWSPPQDWSPIPPATIRLLCKTGTTTALPLCHLSLRCCVFLTIAKGKGMSLGSHGHWSCRATLSQNCCKGIGGENAISVTSSFCKQKSRHPFSTVYMDLKYFGPCKFNKSWWRSGHENQGYHLC